MKICVEKDVAYGPQFREMANSVEQMEADLVHNSSKEEAQSIFTDELKCYTLNNSLKKVGYMSVVYIPLERDILIAEMKSKL